MVDESINKFARSYGAYIKQSNQMFQDYTPLSFHLYEDELTSQTAVQTFRTKPGVDITMSEDMFRQLVTNMEELDSQDFQLFKRYNSNCGQGWLNDCLSSYNQQQREDKLRRSNTTLQTAWEHYQMLLTLHGGV